MLEYERMMMVHGSRKPNRKMNVFGDFPSFFKMVHENVSASNPNCPYAPINGKNYKETH